MGKNEFIWFLIICPYFIYYLIRFNSCNFGVIPKINIFKFIKNKVKLNFQHDIFYFKNNLKCNNIKEFIRSFVIIILGVIIAFVFIPLLLFSQILKWPIIFLNKIISIEKQNGFEFFKYIILPLILGAVFIKYFTKLNIHGTSLNVIVCFYNKLLSLGELYRILIMFLFVFIVFSIFRFIIRNEELFIVDLFNYFDKWIQLFFFVFVYIIILVTYFLLLDEINDGMTSVDSYTIIPIFITCCITSSNIIIKLLTKISINKVKMNYRPKRYPYTNIKNIIR